MTDIEYDTWMLRLVFCLEYVTIIHQTFETKAQDKLKCSINSGVDFLWQTFGPLPILKCAVRTVSYIEAVGTLGPGVPKMTWKKFTEDDCH